MANHLSIFAKLNLERNYSVIEKNISTVLFEIFRNIIVNEWIKLIHMDKNGVIFKLKCRDRNIARWNIYSMVKF